VKQTITSLLGDANQYLRHFWSAYLANSTPSKNKAKTIVEQKIVGIYKQFKNVREFLEPGSRNILNSTMASLKRAIQVSKS